jgi:uncharacterized phiE125 gp8 family phage protein
MYTLSSEIRYSEVAAASGLPFSVADAKDHLHVDGTDHDDYIQLLIKAAYKNVEQTIQRPIMSRQWVQYFDKFPINYGINEYTGLPNLYYFLLYWGNVTAVAHVKYYNTANVLTTFTDYATDLIADRARIVINSGVTIPDTYDRPNAVAVTYTAGFATIPDDIIAAMKLIVGELFEKRENTVKQLPTAAEWLLAPYKLWQI